MQFSGGEPLLPDIAKWSERSQLVTTSKRRSINALVVRSRRTSCNGASGPGQKKGRWKGRSEGSGWASAGLLSFNQG